MLKYILIIFCVARCEGQLSSLLGDPADTRIIGGYDILSTKDDKHLAFLRIEWLFGVIVVQCVGTIITTKHIVTACHCVVGMTKATIRIGSIYSDRGGYVYTATSAFCPLGYNVANNDKDIAIMYVNTEMHLDGVYTGKVSLPPINCTAPMAGDYIHVCGWGRTSTDPNSVPTNEVKCVNIPVVDRKVCEEQYKKKNREITENMFCAGNLTAGGQDSCQGDSGSGTIAYDPNNPNPSSSMQTGVVSWGEGCADQNFAGVYTVVCNFVCWISLMVKLPLSPLELIYCNKIVPTLPELPALT